MVSSADYLEIITRPGRYVLVEKSAPNELLTDDVITIKDADGSDGVEMPPAIFDKLYAKGFLRQDGKEDEQHQVVFVATERACAAQKDSK
jgi:hypothetical protein